QWLNPRGFAIFLNTQRALRDQRYKLVHYSKDELSIQLSNITVHDEGVYKCFHYGIPFKSKNKTVEVLAAPSYPVLEISQNTERNITLSCYTHGCKPQPQVTWLLDNGIELPGDTKHKLEADGKKWTTTSTLTVLAYGPNSTASCIIQHRALGGEKLVSSYQFEDLSRMEVDTQVSGNEQSPELSSSTAPTPSSPPQTAQHRHQPIKISNQMSQLLVKQDLKSDGTKKKNNLLLPSLVAALLFVLLIIVLLFMWKLKKAHGVWKRENDVSEQTLESYKSKPNEDSLDHEKNEQ
ncbi:CRTAM protein, partial [Oreotrochilus melanogaster]|nr:CRTAM protein [Oreotrochilus melanogaster]